MQRVYRARIGGDEVVVLLPGATMEDATAVAERARKLVAEIELPEGKLSCSACVAALSGEPDDLAAGSRPIGCAA